MDHLETLPTRLGLLSDNLGTLLNHPLVTLSAFLGGSKDNDKKGKSPIKIRLKILFFFSQQVLDQQKAMIKEIEIIFMFIIKWH